MIGERNWFVAMPSGRLAGNRVVKKEILGSNLLFWRAGDGQVRAFSNRCPHKGVELSRGFIEKNRLHCPYHGWGFDPDGRCAVVPSAVEGDPLPKCRLLDYPVRESDGWIWIHMDRLEPPKTEPPRYPLHADYCWTELYDEIDVPLISLLENSFDSTHTGFVHAGIFRSFPSEKIDCVVETTETGVKFETLGESNDKFDVRRFLFGKCEIRHTDEYVAPHTIREDYWFGASHATTILICTPMDEGRTMVFSRTGVKFGVLTRFAKPLFGYLTRKIYAQDREIILNQARVEPKGTAPGRHLVAADLATSWLLASYREYCQKNEITRSPSRKRVSFKL